MKALAMALGLCIVAAACGNAQHPQPDVAAAACVSHRTAKELACIDMFADRASIDACRAKVKLDTDCTKDASADVGVGDAE